MRLGRRLPSNCWWVVLLVVAMFGCGQADVQHAQLPTDAVVGDVIDGDTITLLQGEHVRYLGIDTPEVRRREGGRWIYAPEDGATEATELNRRLVKGQRVRLEYDVQSRDKYGRLLAHVWLGDGRLVNEVMLEAGWAKTLSIAPNLRYRDRFRRAETRARKASRGLWAKRLH